MGGDSFLLRGVNNTGGKNVVVSKNNWQDEETRRIENNYIHSVVKAIPEEGESFLNWRQLKSSPNFT